VIDEGGRSVAVLVVQEECMAAKSVAAKARVKAGTTVAVLNSVPSVVESLGLPEDVTFVDPGKAQLVFLFVDSRPDLESRMPAAIGALAAAAALWVFFRKGSKAAKSSSPAATPEAARALEATTIPWSASRGKTRRRTAIGSRRRLGVSCACRPKLNGNTRRVECMGGDRVRVSARHARPGSWDEGGTADCLGFRPVMETGPAR
jgi:hypothetical protein